MLPHTMAASHCPLRMDEKAESSANMALLHAVSMVNEGPVKPNE